MQNEQEIIIKLNNSLNASITIKGKDKTINKNVSIDSLVTSIVSNNKISTGILPRGTRFFSGTQSNYSIGIEVPRNIRSLRYVRDGIFEYNIPFPVCFFVFGIENCILKTTKVFSLSNPITSNNDFVFGFPFGNTYADGKVCWGGVNVPTINSPFELLSLIGLFLGSEYNGDLIGYHSFGTGSNEEIQTRSVKSLLEFLNKKETFPNELLVKSEYQIKNFMS
jgi:hypothetical protein